MYSTRARRGDLSCNGLLQKIYVADLRKPTFAYPLADARHKLVEKIQIVNGREAACTYIFAAKETVQFSARDLFFRAHQTAAIRRDRLAVVRILPLSADIQPSFFCP